MLLPRTFSQYTYRAKAETVAGDTISGKVSTSITHGPLALHT